MNRGQQPHHPQRERLIAEQQLPPPGNGIRLTVGTADQRAQINREEIGIRRNRRPEPGRERRPTRQESPQRTVRLAKVNVLTADARHGRTEFAVTDGAQQRKHAAGKPDRHDPTGMPDVAGHEPGRTEDAGADHVGNDDTRRRHGRHLSQRCQRRTRPGVGFRQVEPSSSREVIPPCENATCSFPSIRPCRWVRRPARSRPPRVRP